ncbi:hypothetical protein [Mesorhizobium sp. B2-8-5]|uniref:hypothetical protein n=1 Tax=Mesorhizobium sp. B2-8-5 TaxID=2589903 RepID=UPI00112941D7|nr:hypothetical protein [Mesorhizobium sp. B2-8-5]UCI26876.1 hypothetical protein FJ430_04565 [Mesorhizobium sp. B2-8-5]
MVLLGLTREQAEEFASQANELLSTPRPAVLSRYSSLLSILYWPALEQSDSVSTSMRVVGARCGSGATTWAKQRLRPVSYSVNTEPALATLKQGASMRFAAMRDPCDDWLVCDLAFDIPAEMVGRPLIGLTRGEAEQLADLANARLGGQTASSPIPFASVA